MRIRTYRVFQADAGGGAGGDGGTGDAGNPAGAEGANAGHQGPAGNEGGAAGAGGSWLDGLSPDAQVKVSTLGFNTPDDLAKAYMSLETKVGAKGVILPGENATDAERDAFYTALGRPESPDKYDLGDFKPPEAPGLQWDGEAQTAALAKFHELGMTNAQAAGVMAHYGEYVKGLADKTAESDANEAAAAEAALRKEWGTAYDAKLDQANKVIRQFGNDALVDELAQNLGRNAELVKTLSKVAEAFGEDGPLGDATVQFAKSPAEAKAAIDALESDPEKSKALYDQSHPQHAAVLKERDALFKMAYPEPQKQAG